MLPPLGGAAVAGSIGRAERHGPLASAAAPGVGVSAAVRLVGPRSRFVLAVDARALCSWSAAESDDIAGDLQADPTTMATMLAAMNSDLTRFSMRPTQRRATGVIDCRRCPHFGVGSIAAPLRAAWRRFDRGLGGAAGGGDESGFARRRVRLLRAAPGRARPPTRRCAPSAWARKLRRPGTGFERLIWAADRD